ncbi:hypothetical protein JAAARDRAFT_211610 [Jaapia argillacea MUCL 33604]|uniref:Uncharacterized protein n=1 Tax=Jaapia argillacea MUCL 33604 TaxID=933084 RepID=A0A067P9T2_9AGAM|nr:hypothetical protein JAAARDRAFT_211610 [Jaapia argillacea MUCL 33604]
MLQSPPNWIFSTCSFIGFTLVAIPFYWQLEYWNTGACLYIGWTAIQLLNLFINSIIWNGNALNPAPIWCDISSRVLVGSSVAILAASLCINRRLYHMVSIKYAVKKSKAERRREMNTDLAIGLGIPLFQMCLQYIVEGHRFNIFEDIGCYPFTWNVTPAYPLVFCVPLLISVISAYYSIRTIRCVIKRRRELSGFLSSNRNLTQHRYFRLMSLAGIELLCGVPLSSWSLYLNIRSSPIQKWVSLAVTHYDFSRVDQFPSVLWKAHPTLATSLELSRWSPVFCAVVFFAFFGFAEEARKHYDLLFSFIKRSTGWSGTATLSNGAVESSQFTCTVSMPRTMYDTGRNRGSSVSFSGILDSILVQDIGVRVLDEKAHGSLPSGLRVDVPEDGISIPRPEPTVDLSLLQRLSTGSKYSCFIDKIV